MNLLHLLLALQQVAAQPLAQDVAWAADGRLAASIQGDLWVRTAARDSAHWRQVTHGAAWDRSPAWAADGRSIVYVSNAGGVTHLYRVQVDAGDADRPERIGASTEPERDPAIAPDGRLAFVRGRGPLARLWLRGVDGTERRLTRRDDGAERWPAWSPDGSRIAYSAVSESRTRLRMLWPVGDSSRVVVEDRDAERASWAPDGSRIAFASRAGRPGVWVTTPDARYVNLVSERRAAPAWSPDGRTLALVELPPADVSYNGDPDRVGDRELRDRFASSGHLWLVDAPAVPDAGSIAATLASVDRAARNDDAFSAAWAQSDTLYFASSPARRARWLALRDRYASRARAARDDRELQDVLHELLRERPPLRDDATGRAAVSSAHPVATAAGLEMLRRGGNVVDAAVAISFALGVVEPDASGIGGYGQMLVRLARMPRPALIEFMARAPEEATLANGALLRRGAYPEDGPAIVNVPGTVAGMDLAWRRFGSGKLTWADLVAPAIRAAEQGYVVSEGLATTIATERTHFMRYPGSRALFFPGGVAVHAGDTLRNPDLARTLRAIADSGSAALYTGDVGRRMVADLRGRGNAMRTSDLARYYAAEREPVEFSYHGSTIYSSAPPASGGPTLAAQLQQLELARTRGPYTEDAATLHAMIESWKLVPSSRGRIADPGLWPVRIDAFTSRDSAAVRWRCFNPARALVPDDVRGDSLPCARPPATKPSATPIPATGDIELAAEASSGGCVDHPSSSGSYCHSTGTTSFSIADVDGNAVSVTQTLGTWGGSFYVSPGLGFLYNDKLTSYGNDPDEYGARLPNARHGSTLAPTIVFRGEGASRRPVLATGAAGNAWITSAVYAIVTGVLDAHLDAQHAIEQPRFLLTQRSNGPRRDYVVQVEDGIAPSVLRELEAKGHLFERISLTGELRMGYGSAVTIGERSATAAADPRRAGAAGAIP